MLFFSTAMLSDILLCSALPAIRLLYRFVLYYAVPYRYSPGSSWVSGSCLAPSECWEARHSSAQS